jgi:isocitrate/isopropylmalate dehydrogenase
MKTIVALPGEGIGLEVVDATCELLAGTGLPLKILTPPQGLAAMKSHGVPLPDETKQAAREADGVLFGAAGGLATSAVVGWLRWEMGAWAGVRPIKHYQGVRSPLADPAGIDYVIVRENSEGLYPGREGELADLAQVMPDLGDNRTGRPVKAYGAGRFAVKVVTPGGVERIARFACRLARERKAAGKPGKVTCVTKANVLPRSDGLFREITERVVREAGDLQFEHFYVDDASRRLVRFPRSMDVVLAMNLYADVLSDLGAETAGGLGLAPSGCFGDGWAYFESVHGSAPDIAGQGIANPTGTILSAAMMLGHLGLAAEATRLEAAVARTYRDGVSLTRDQGGTAGTRDMARAVLAAYRNA